MKRPPSRIDVWLPKSKAFRWRRAKPRAGPPSTKKAVGVGATPGEGGGRADGTKGADEERGTDGVCAKKKKMHSHSSTLVHQIPAMTHGEHFGVSGGRNDLHGSFPFKAMRQIVKDFLFFFRDVRVANGPVISLDWIHPPCTEHYPNPFFKTSRHNLSCEEKLCDYFRHRNVYLCIARKVILAVHIQMSCFIYVSSMGGGLQMAPGQSGHPSTKEAPRR